MNNVKLILQHILSYNSRTIFLCMFTIVGLVSSRAVMSIGTIALFVNIILVGDYKNTLKKFYAQKELFAISFLFFAALISLVFTSNKTDGLQFVINKLPLIVMPLALSRFKNFGLGHLYVLLSFFVLVALLSVSVVMFTYYQDFEIVTNNLKKGQALWVPLNHIRYGLTLTFAFISAIFLILKNTLVFKEKQMFLKYLFGFIALILFITIHILAIRSAILTLYLSMLFSLFYYVLKTKKYKLFALSLVFILSIPIVSYYTVASFQNKFNYMKYDWKQYLKKDIGNNSDARRLRSYKVGFELVKEKFLFGFGVGNTKKGIDAYYQKKYPAINIKNRISPHNQFLYTLIDYGLIGLFGLCITLFFSLYWLKNKKGRLLFLLFWIIANTPLLFDISLEMQLGITFFSLFSSLLLKQIADQTLNLSYENRN